MALRFSDIPKYARLGVMKLQGKEVICHSVGEQCKKTRINAMDLVDGARVLYTHHIQEPVNREYQDEALIFTEQKERQLSAKEAAQLIWHSFRFSNGNPILQFTVLYLIWKSLGSQEISVEEVYDRFLSLMNIGALHITRQQVENRDWRPPHPKVDVLINETHTDVGISTSSSHTTIRSKSIEEGIEFIKMLLSGDGKQERYDRDGDYSISRTKGYEHIGANIQGIFQSDFKYLLKQKIDYTNKGYSEIFVGRPNRKAEHDGENNMKDRFFSYFVWYIVRKNKTKNDFFDEYFTQLQDFFPKWFVGLPTDKELKEENERQKAEKDWYSGKSSYRKDKEYGIVTKDDVLLLIAQYNATHPDTQVSMSELGLFQKPIFQF